MNDNVTCSILYRTLQVSAWYDIQKSEQTMISAMYVLYTYHSDLPTVYTHHALLCYYLGGIAWSRFITLRQCFRC